MIVDTLDEAKAALRRAWGRTGSFIGTDRRHPRLFSGPMAEPRKAAAIAHNPDLDTWSFCTAPQADLREQIRLSQETVERSQELLRQIDDLLAK